MLSGFRLITLPACCLMISAPGFAQDWEFTLAPYAVAPFIDGETSLGRIEDAGLDVEPVNILDVLDATFMIYGEAVHENGWGVMADYSFMDLKESGSFANGAGIIDVDLFQGAFMAAVLYRVHDGDAPLDLYGGVRWWDMDVDVDATLGPVMVDAQSGDSWVDPILGARKRWPIGSGNWDFVIQADIGGFGVGSDLQWFLQPGVEWHVSDGFSLALNYRALAVDYSEGSAGDPDRFAYDTITHGPMAGFAFHF